MKATLLVIATAGNVTENDLLSLSQAALGLLDAFAKRRVSGSYNSDGLVTVKRKLR